MSGERTPVDRRNKNAQCFPGLRDPSALLFFFTAPSAADEKPDGSNWPEICWSGSDEGRYLALSFDDGPTPDTAELLAILDELDVRATFFVCGEYCDWRPELLRAIADAGHEIGNHTYHHPNMTRLEDGSIAEELESTNRTIKALTGIIPHLFRPPGGSYDSRVVDAVYSHEMTTVIWSVCCDDYRNPPASRIVNCVTSRAGSGSIVLLHDGKSHTREALPEIVNTLRSEGYEFVTIGELIEMTYGPCPWQGKDTMYEEFPELHGVF